MMLPMLQPVMAGVVVKLVVQPTMLRPRHGVAVGVPMIQMAWRFRCSKSWWKR